ncbi:MAG: hypothetical protein GWP04_00240 [Gammaproteobacteria bacterium]|nr:hypothetical protein [Gammaproteobacteria bacterium]
MTILPQGRGWARTDDGRLVTLYLRMRVWLSASAASLTTLMFLLSGSPEAARLAIVTTLLAVHAQIGRRQDDRRVARALLADATVVGLTLTTIAIPAVAIAGLAFLIAVSTLLLSHRHAVLVWVYGVGWAALSVWQTNNPRSLPDPIQKPAEAIAIVFFLGSLAAVVGIVTKALRRSAREQIDARKTIEVREQQLRSSNAKLSALVLSKDQFIAAVSHELRTPLTAVVGLARELTQREFHRDERIEFQDIIAVQASEVSNIVEDLLVAARRDVGITVHPERCHLPDLLHTVASAIPVPISMTFEDQLEAFADPLRLRQVIRNLLTNAQRYGGKHIELEAASNNETITIEVRDDGPGIEGIDAERIFQAYETASTIVAQPASIGLGLSVARTLARLMGGDVRHRRDDGWTVFSLEVPAVSPDTSTCS